jgi:hypothetical protein
VVRDDVISYLKLKKQSFVLFDNLDRGWPENGLGADDILIIRCLIDAGRKIQREMRAAGLQFSCLVFLRNDVYQLLMLKTADFGKDLRAQLDWTDADQMQEMMRLRLVQNEADKGVPFDAAWRRICVSHVDGEDSFQYLVDRSLYRPRNLLKLFYYCRAAAINVGKDRIDEDDLRKGMESFSIDLVIEADREMSDVLPGAAGRIYNFVDENHSYSYDDLQILLKGQNDSDEDLLKLVEYMLYFGTLGIQRNNEVRYIYNVGYDMNILRAEITKFHATVRYVINPAFWPALRIHTTDQLSLI